MRILLATDHAGFEHKEALKVWLEKHEYQVVDCGARTHDPDDDFPDFIASAAEAVSKDPQNTRAIIFGGSGQGEAILANKYSSVRAVVYYGSMPDIVPLSREHNDANILSIGARFVTIPEMTDVVSDWLATAFSNEERHIRRIKKIAKLERAHD